MYDGFFFLNVFVGTLIGSCLGTIIYLPRRKTPSFSCGDIRRIDF